MSDDALKNNDFPSDAKYGMSKQDVEKIQNNFTYHAPQDDQVKRYVDIRDQARGFAYMLTMNCPPSRELSLALTNLEQAVFWANAAIARNETPTA